MDRQRKRSHEIRDPIHVFIRMDSDEREVLNSRPLQRLRHIHQLGLSYLVYPGATHCRFEHSLGVMDLAGRVFDVLTRQENLHDSVRNLIPDQDELRYWRRVLRMAALCHDVGHVAFSHTAETELLPDGWDHEALTVKIIRSTEMERIWNDMKPPLRSSDIVKLAVGPKKVKKYVETELVTSKEATYSDWEAILAEVIVGDSFGVDRMDYLLRDSHHAGVSYGRFDHYRLMDTLRILPSEHLKGSQEPMLGIEEGGLHCAEALLLARYFMYTQVYFHPVRRIYDIHLKDFLKKWLPEGEFPIEVNEHLALTDHEVSAALLEAARNPSQRGHSEARRIFKREHFRRVYQRNPKDMAVNPNAAKLLFDAACKQFGEDAIRLDYYRQKGGSPDFPVLTKDSRVISSLALSTTLKTLPVAALDYIFIDPSKRREAEDWFEKQRDAIIARSEEETDEADEA